MNSMTGFGRAEAQAEHQYLEVELTSVNRKSLEITFSLPREWLAAEPVFREALASRIQRGAVQATLRPGSLGSKAGDSLEARLAEFIMLAGAHGIEPPLTAEVLYRLWREAPCELPLPPWSKIAPAAEAAVQRAVAALLESRAREGAHLRGEFTTRLGSLKDIIEEISSATAAAPVDHQRNLLQRLAKYKLGFDLSDERVLREIALYAERSDVSEELARLSGHRQALLEALEAPGPIGRTLEFTLQEIHRELNTIGSKTATYEISRLVIEAKQEAEKMREQAANVE